MKRMMKTAAMLLLTILLLQPVLTVLAAGEDGEKETAETVTRIEWFRQLTNVFEMSVDANNYPDNFFADLDSDSEYYRDIMVATEFGLVDVPGGGDFLPEEPITREDAAHTFNYCMGYSLGDEEYTYAESDSVKYPEDIQIAINRGWFSADADGQFQPSEGVTADEMEAMMDIAAEWVDSNKHLSEKYSNTYEYAAGVIALPKSATVIFMEKDEYTLKNCNVVLKPGDIFGFEAYGVPVVKKVVAIQSTEEGYQLTTTDVSLEESFKHVDVSGSSSINLMDIAPADENADIVYIVGGTEENNWEDGTVYSSKEELLRDGIDSVSAVTITQDYYEDMDGVYGGAPISGSLDLNHSGLLCSVSYTITDLDIDVGFNPFTETYCIASGDLTMSVKLGTDIDFIPEPPHLKIYYGPITVLEIKAVLGYSGTYELAQTVGFEMGVRFPKDESARPIFNFTKKEFTLISNNEFTLGVRVSTGVDLVAVSGMLFLESGVKAKVASNKYNDHAPYLCVDYHAYWYLNAGAELEAKVFGVKYTKQMEIYNDSNSPIRISKHLDDNVETLICKRELSDEEAGGEIGAGVISSFANRLVYAGKTATGALGKRTYRTPTTSKYISTGANSGIDVKGEPIKYFDYTLNANGEATLTAYNGNTSIVVVPEKIDGHTVVAIGDRCFNAKKNITTVRLPETITSIGENAFSYCGDLTNINLPSNLKILKSYAFSGCKKLTEITIPKTVDVDQCGHDIFSFCSTLEKITIEQGLTGLPVAMFNSCAGLKEITIPSSVKKIGTSAFVSCSGLEKVTLFDGLVTIGSNAFARCSNLKQIVIPDSVIEIGDSAFRYDEGLHTVKLPVNLQCLAYAAFGECQGLTEIEIPKNVRTTSTYTYKGLWCGPFGYCANLKKITFAEGSTVIGYGILAGCIGAKEIVIPDSVTEIGVEAFAFCPGIEYLSFPKNLKKIGDNAFRNCESLQEIELPDDVESLGADAFGYCYNMKRATLSKSLKEVRYAFECCTALEEIAIPKSLSVEDTNTTFNAFVGCSNLRKASFEEGTTIICYSLFYNCPGLEEVVIPNTVEKIKSCAFQKCGRLKRIEIPASVTFIETSAFGECTQLEEVIFANSAEKNAEDRRIVIKADAFSNCVGLSKLVLPDQITELGERAFANCTALEEINIPSSIEVVEYEYGGPFSGCHNLNSIHFAEGITQIPAGLLEECGGIREIVIPETVVNIGAHAFRNCINLETLVLPNSLRTMEYSFWGCTSLKSVTIPNNLDTNRCCGAFYGCEKLSDIHFAEGIKVIPYSILWGCQAIRKIAIPETVEKIDHAAFWNSNNLTEIYIPETTVVIGDSIVSEPAKVTIVGTRGSTAEAYANEKGYRFLGRKVVTTGDIFGSEHNYAPGQSDEWSYTIPGATKIGVTFSKQSELVSGVDYLYLYDGENKEVAKLTGTQMADQTFELESDTIRIKLISNGKEAAWGFEVTEVKQLLPMEMAIEMQPEDQTVTEGETCSFSVEALGGELTYQWQKSTNGGKTWVNSASAGAQTSELTLITKLSFNGLKFRCKITDNRNKVIYSDAATLTVKPSVAIEQNPENAAVLTGETVTFAVKATGENLTYQWQKSTNDGATWVNSSSTGAKTDCLTMTAKLSYNGYLFRCKIMTAAGKVLYTAAAVLDVKDFGTVISQPENQVVFSGTTALFNVTAAGTGNTYQWQKSTDGGVTWVNSSSTGAKTETLSVTTKMSFNGILFRCKVTNANKKAFYSDPASLTVTNTVAVASQPADMTVKAGGVADFVVTAVGEGLTYQWQKSMDGGSKWVNCSSAGAKTAQMPLTVKASYNGWRFRCVITDGTGNSVTSNTAVLTVK